MSLEEPLNEAGRRARRRRVEQRARQAIEHLAAVDLAAAAAVLRVGRIEVADDGRVPTAALMREQGFSGARFKIVLNAEFCDRPQEELTAIMLHELLHHIMRHLEDERPGPDAHLSNVVEDAFINRTIQLLNPQLGQFFRDFYPADQMPALMLRSGSQPVQPADQRLYEAHYSGGLTERDLYAALAQQGGAGAPVQLIGSHDPDGDNGSALPPGGVEQVLGELQEQLAARGADREAQRIGQQAEEFLRLRRAGRLRPLEEALRRALTDQLRSQLVTQVVGGEGAPLTRSPLMPERPARADLYWVLAGMEPPLWRIPEAQHPRGAVAIYLDVSGSMSAELAFVYECCLAFEELLHTEIFLFSERVQPVTLAELQAGRVSTSYGTSFNCVVQDLLERPQIKKAILFTDGYASLSADLAEQLRSSDQQLIGVLTARGQQSAVDSFCTEVHRLPDRSG